jgi:tRNA nucleotidyltransferase (CCA-adding enzyme)
LLKALCQRYKIPKSYQEIARITVLYHTRIHCAFTLTAEQVVDVLNHCDVMRKPERFSQMLLMCEADSRGRTGYENAAYPQRLFYETAATLYREVSVQDIIRAGYKGVEIKHQLQQNRVRVLQTHCA